MNKLIPIILFGLFLTGCQATTLQMRVDENTKKYSTINDPTYGKVHSFEFGSECGDLKRNSQGSKSYVGKWHDSDCGQNSVRSEISQNSWTQPKESWYRWNVFLPKDFPIQEGGKLLLGQFHNGECSHVAFTSEGRDEGTIYFETSKTWQGDCASTKRIPFTSIQKLRGKWTEFVMYSRWENNQDGQFVIYLDGVQVVNYKGRTLTKGKERDNYVKVGIYQCCNGGYKIKPASALFTTPERSSKSFFSN